MNAPIEDIDHSKLRAMNSYIPDDIQSLLDDVQEDEIVDVLVDTNEVGMLLHAISVHSKDDIDSLVRILEKKADQIRENFALKNRSPYA